MFLLIQMRRADAVNEKIKKTERKIKKIVEYKINQQTHSNPQSFDPKTSPFPQPIDISIHSSVKAKYQSYERIRIRIEKMIPSAE